MAVNGGPKIPKDGLVLSLDAANSKSFRGEPTTNEIVAVTWSGDGSNQTSFTKQVVLITDENLKYNGYETYLWSPGTNLNCYLNGADLSTSRTSDIWTFSCYVKRQDGAPITSLNVYMYYPSTDGDAAGTIESVGDGWYRISRTRTGTENYLSLVGFTGFTAGYKYFLSAPQLEKKTYATRPVLTNSTRGSTVATGGGWSDLTNNSNHGELINGTAYDSGSLGSLSFDGVNDYIDLGNISASGEMTVIAWIKTPNTLSGYKHIVDSSNNTWHLAIADNKLYFYNSSTYHSIYSDYTTLSANTNHMVVGRQSTTNDIFVDGELVKSLSSNVSLTTNNVVLGKWQTGGRYFNRNIYSVQIYNRALTAEEIKNIYAATRGRYGI